LTAIAVYLVVRKIDLRQTLSVFTSLRIGWIALAFLFFNFSKIVSAFRLQELLKAIKIYLSNILTLKLCYVGMFYNLFLPGGIGGDGYKVYLLKKWNQDGSLKKIVSAALLDRISGMLALLFLAGILFSLTSVSYLIKDPRLNFAYFLLLAVFYPFLFLLNKIVFKSFRSAFLATNFQSITVQVFQLISAFFILMSMGIDTAVYDYLDLFLISSVVAVLPITIGGIGARELVFIYGYEYLAVDKNSAVAFSLMFFVLTVVSALFGSLLQISKDD